jgi:hypothetical protein
MTFDSSTQTPTPAAASVTPAVQAVIEKWLKPKVEKQHDEAELQALLTKFQEYLETSFAKQSWFSVLVFKNQQRQLEELYIPLTVVSGKDAANIKIDSYHDDFIPKYQKVLITDTAGMGKSTVLRYLFISCLKANKGLPIFVELRKLGQDFTIFDYLSAEIGVSKNFLEKVFKQGDFIFFLDGFDETSYEHREQITASLQNFISQARKNLFALTSRPELSLVSFPDFQNFNIKPLELAEAFALIEKYGCGGELSARIIAAIKSGQYENIKEFLTNPLLVSLLYKSYEFKPKIPFKKHIFYRQVYDALFEAHDLSKPSAPIRTKRSGLDIDDFHRVLRVFGYTTMNMGKIEYDRDEIGKLLTNAKERCPGLDFKPADLLDDLVTTVPLFVRSGESFKWAHKAIQEYFAAQYICVDSKDKQAKILRSIYRSEGNERYYNVLDLCYDIDYKTFRNSIIYELVSDFIKHHETSYTGFKNRAIAVQAIDQRKTLTFGYVYIIDNKKQEKKFLFNINDFIRMRDLLVYLKKQGKIPKGFQLAPRNFSFWGQRLPLIQCQNHVPPILTLLYAKKEDLFLDVPKAPAIATVFIRGPVVVDDNPDSKINSDIVFVKVNNLILSFVGSRHPFLDLTKSRGLKHTIEVEGAREDETDLLLGTP